MLALNTALYSKLSGDVTLTNLATGGINSGTAPQGTNGYVLTFQNTSSIHEYSFGRLAKITCIYLLKAYADGLDWDTPQSIIERAIAILFDASWSVSGYDIRSRGSNKFDSQEDVDGKPVAVTVGQVTIEVMPA